MRAVSGVPRFNPYARAEAAAVARAEGSAGVMVGEAIDVTTKRAGGLDEDIGSTARTRTLIDP